MQEQRERQEGYEADEDLRLQTFNAQLFSDESMSEVEDQAAKSKFLSQTRTLKVPRPQQNYVKWNTSAQIGYEKEFDSADYELEVYAVKKAKEKQNQM